MIEGLTDLEKKREAIIAEIVSSLSTQMGNKGKEKLDHHVKHDVKGKMKLFTGPAAPAEKHH